MNMNQYSLKNNKYISISILIIVLIWQMIAVVVDNSLLLPSFFDVLKSGVNIIKNKSFINLIASSSYRCIESFVLSLMIATIIAIASYLSKFIYNFLYPIMSFIKSVPTMAFIVLILIWTSKGIAPVVIGIMISLPIFYDIVLNSLLNIDKDLIYMCRVYQVAKLDNIKHIIIPFILIEIKKCISSTLSLIFKVVISGEVYAQPEYGIGAAIQLEKMQLNTDSVIAWMIIITVVIYCFDLCIDKILKLKSSIKERKYDNRKYKY